MDELKDWLIIGYKDWLAQGQLRPASPNELGVAAKQMHLGVDKIYGNGDGQLSFEEHIKFVMSG